MQSPFVVSLFEPDSVLHLPHVLKNQIKTLELENAKYTAEIQTLLAKIRTLEPQNAEYKAKIRTLEPQNAEYKAKIRTLEPQNAEYKAKIRTLEPDNAEYKAKIHKLELREEQLTGTIDQLEKGRRAWQDEYEASNERWLSRSLFGDGSLHQQHRER